MSKGKNPHFCYFEIPADNVERSKSFYSELFDWEIDEDENTPSEEYFMIKHGGEEGKVDKGEHPKYFAGMIKRKHPGQPIVIYIEVPSLKSYIDKVRKLGGTIVEERKAVKGMGYFGVCKDTENNLFALWEPNLNAY
jgi:uncharacterized protein